MPESGQTTPHGNSWSSSVCSVVTHPPHNTDVSGVLWVDDSIVEQAGGRKHGCRFHGQPLTKLGHHGARLAVILDSLTYVL